MTEPAKYLFDCDFSQADEGPAKPRPKKPIYTEDDLEAARAEAFQGGHSEGERAAHNTIEADTNAALQVISGKLESADDSLGSAMQQLRAQLVTVTLEIAKTLARQLIDAHPLEHIKDLVEQSLRDMAAEPRLLFRVSPAVVDAIQTHLDGVAKDTGFEGRVIVVEEPAFGPGDCVVEWADGGVQQNQEALEESAATAIAEYLATQTAPRQQQENDADTAAEAASGPPPPDASASNDLSTAV